MNFIRNKELRQDKELGIRAATVIQFASRYINLAVSLVVSMVLARLLTPEQYGVMAIITVFIGLFSMISNVGINAAVIQYRELDHDDCEALLSFTLLLGIGMTLLFCLVSFPIAAFYDDPQYVPLMFAASLSVLFQSTNMVPNGLLVREKKFLAIGIRLVVTSLVAGCVAILLALADFGIYALIINTVLQSLLNLVWNLAASGLRFGNWNFKPQLQLVGKFSTFQFGSQIVNYSIRNVDTLLVGSVLGPTVLGLYDKGYKLAKYPVNIVPSTLTPVLKSFFSSLEGDLDKLYELYFKIEKVLSILGVFCSVVMYFCAEELILLCFGEQWTDSVEPFRMLSIGVVFQMVNFTVFSVLEGAKRTDLLFRNTVFSAVSMVGLLLAGLYTRDIVIVSLMVSLAFALYTVNTIHYVVGKVFQRPIPSYLLKFMPEALSGAVCAVVLAALSMVVPSNLFASLCIKATAAGVVYFLLLWPLGQLKYLRMIVRSKGRA